MKLIVGLGNPGKEYHESFHNAGFMVLDALAEELPLATWQEKFKGLTLKASLQGRPFVCLKPLTYMNLSGQSVVACMNFYKFTVQNLLVVSDDMDLELGRLRFREKGGHGGHNGLRNIIELLGTPNFARLKVGIGRPRGKETVGHVLGKPKGEQRDAFLTSIGKTAEYIKEFIEGRALHIEPEA